MNSLSVHPYFEANKYSKRFDWETRKLNVNRQYTDQFLTNFFFLAGLSFTDIGDHRGNFYFVCSSK